MGMRRKKCLRKYRMGKEVKGEEEGRGKDRHEKEGEAVKTYRMQKEEEQEVRTKHSHPDTLLHATLTSFRHSPLLSPLTQMTS